MQESETFVESSDDCPPQIGFSSIH